MAEWSLGLAGCLRCIHAVCPAGFAGLPHQWLGHPGLRLISQQTEDVSGRGEGGVWRSRGSTV